MQEIKRSKNIYVLTLLIAAILFCYESNAQTGPFRKNEIIDAGNGMKVEVLSCRGIGEDEECDVIYYTDKRYLGKRMWQKSSVLKELKLSSRMAAYKSSKTPPQTSSVKKPATPSKTSVETKKPNTNPSKPATSETKTPIVKDTLLQTIIVTRKTSEPINQNDKIISTDTSKANTGEQKVTGSNNVQLTVASHPSRYTLANLYNIAKERSIAIKQSQNLIKGNEIDHKIAKNNFLPSVSYNLGHYLSRGKNIDPVTNTFSFENFSGGYTALSMQMDLFSGFSRVNSVKQAEYSIKAAEFSKKRVELELLTNITLAYARLLLNKEQLAVERSIIQNTSREIEVINEKINVGRLSKYEFYTFNSRLNTQQANLVTFQNDSLTAVNELKVLLNLPATEAIDIIPIDTLVLSEIYNMTISIPDYVDPILKNHPAIKQAEMEKQVAEMGEKIARSNLYPSLSLGGNLNSNYNANQINVSGSKVPLGTQLNDNMGQNIYINLRIPIFSQNENANRIKKEQINIANIELNRQAAINTITSNTLQLLNEFNGAKTKYMATRSAWEQNKLSYDLHVEKYRVGQISSVELLTAQDTFNASTSRYVQTRLQLFFQYQLLQLLKSYN